MTKAITVKPDRIASPWEMRPHEPGVIRTKSASFERVATVQISNVPNWEDIARIIVEAPSMLATLEAIRQLLGGSAQGRGTEVFSLVTDAITRARGPADRTCPHGAVRPSRCSRCNPY